MDITFRRATLDDADAVGRITALSWQQAYQGFVPDGAAKTLHIGRDLLEIRYRRNL